MKKNKQADQQAGIRAVRTHEAGALRDESRRKGRIGTGWSRAPDLSVYAAMDAAGEMAREQDVLCSGGNPAVVVDHWRARFGAREDWIALGLSVPLRVRTALHAGAVDHVRDSVVRRDRDGDLELVAYLDSPKRVIAIHSISTSDQATSATTGAKIGLNSI